MVVDADYVLTVPEGIDPAAAAPLLCAGITTYAPLRKWEAGAGKKVAVVGFGGLGHMAVKIAHTMGAEVTVLSQSLKKQEDGLRLGAHDYHVFSLIGARRSFAGSMIGGIALTQEMLGFCAEHDIGAEVEVIPADRVDEAYERVLASDVRYRFVIDTSTLG